MNYEIYDEYGVDFDYSYLDDVIKATLKHENAVGAYLSVIFIDDDLTFSKLKIMIKANIITNEKLDVETQYDEIDKKINYIYNEMLKVINNKYSSPPDAPLNLVVLTANPLMNGEKELLRTMNDFNILFFYLDL